MKSREWYDVNLEDEILYSEKLLWKQRYERFHSSLWKNSPILVAAITLFSFLWAGRLLFTQPYTGLIWSYQTGVVLDVDPQSHTSFKPGDIIRSFDGIAPYQARGLPGKQFGDVVAITFTREGHDWQISLILDQPPIWILLSRLSTIFVALSYWLLGILIVAFGPQDRSVTMFFIFTNTFSIMLSLGSVSAIAPLWAGWIFSLMLWWMGPIVFHAHILLSRPVFSKNRGKILACVYLPALVLTAFDIVRLSMTVPGLQEIKYSWLGICLAGSALILIYTSHSGNSVDLRRKMEIAGLSALLAFLPFVLFSLLPNALVGHYILPYEISFLALPVLPLGYGYAILRYKLIRIERYINRSFAYALVILIIGAIYGLIYLSVPHILPDSPNGASIIGFGIAMLLIIGAHPLYKVLQRGIDKVFYGGWFDDRLIVKQVSRALNQADGDAFNIAFILCQALKKTLQLEYATLVLSDGRVISTGPLPGHSSGNLFIAEEASAVQLFDELKAKVGREIGTGLELIDVLRSSCFGCSWIVGRKPQFWLLMCNKQAYRGMLILGNRYGGGEFAPGDLEILEVVIRQAEVALENEFLLDEVRQRSIQIKDLHRQVLLARDEERKRVARNLHDKTIQALVGINYQMSDVRVSVNYGHSQKFADIQEQLRTIIRDLRQVCADLRPPAIDTLGLIPAIQSHISELQGQVPFEIKFCVSEPDNLDVPEDIALCIYRFYQEAVLNVRKHADASIVSVCFTIDSDERFNLSITDNGCGFLPPVNLGVLTQTRHFGLVGLQEQVEAIGGSLSIQSAPGAGCCITASVPINRIYNH
ncbi:hypothetical protein EG832_04660 [bacterium]|nr:hypothetical protein [bacterium]